ncbi:uncharacterized protein LOC123010143 [Tribolium madens]|uniref:uncharacterized protein LOC123010143 n=1 Tax=Tribolium madens TaxID=41895 RepID=UPI001CF74313|nr:uncharacterized protein LOC123010143 [Tribolium madens]
MKKMVIGAAEKLITLNNYEEPGDTGGSSDTTPDDFFDFNEPEDPTKQVTQTLPQSQSATENEAVKTSKIELELYKFLDEKKSGLSSLNDYPIIKKVFLRYNTCLPSSTPVERLFSFATIVNSPRRNALTDANFEKLVIMKANRLMQ